MPYKDLFLTKVKDLRYTYGKEESEYFRKHPHCEHCPEERLVTLGIHHTHGKSVKKFKVLCHNCHAVVHATKTGPLTYKQYKKQQDIKSKKKQQLITNVRNMHSKGYSLRAIGREFKLSHVTIKNWLQK